MDIPTPPPAPATERDIRSAIYLCGIRGSYDVHHDIPGEAIVCHVSSVDVGNAIIRALRARQSERIAAAASSRRRAADRREYGVDTERELAGVGR